MYTRFVQSIDRFGEQCRSGQRHFMVEMRRCFFLRANRGTPRSLALCAIPFLQLSQ
jgi:hypothetical protein